MHGMGIEFLGYLTIFFHIFSIKLILAYFGISFYSIVHKYIGYGNGYSHIVKQYQGYNMYMSIEGSMDQTNMQKNTVF